MIVPPLAKSTIDEHTYNVNTFTRPKLGSLEVRKVKPSDVGLEVTEATTAQLLKETPNAVDQDEQ